MLSDIEIAHQARLREIDDVAGDLGINYEELEHYVKNWSITENIRQSLTKHYSGE